MMLFIIIQVLAIVFAIVCARHDAPAVLHFENYGFPNEQKQKKVLKQFHRNNWWLKFFFCTVVSMHFIPEWLEVIVHGSIAGLWIYLVFDIVLNLCRGIEWDYLGSYDKDGNWWRRWFGKNAGRVKALILIVLIIAVNVLKMV